MNQPTLSKSKKPDFGDLLASFREANGLSVQQLSDDTGFSINLLIAWENKTNPVSHVNIDAIARLSKALSLSERQYRQLNDAYQRLTNTKPKRMYKRYTQKLPSSQTDEYITLPAKNRYVTDETAAQEYSRILVRQLEEIKNSLESLGERIPDNDKSGDSSEVDSLSVTAEIDAMKDTITELQDKSSAITAPVLLPELEQMTTHLVPSTLLQHLEEYRSEETKWYSWSGIFVGAIIGLMINWVTTENVQISAESWILFGTFAVVAGLTGWTAYGYQRKAIKLRKRLFVDIYTEDD